MNDRSVRRVRRAAEAPAEQPTPPPSPNPEPEPKAPRRGYVAALGGVIEGTVEIDVDAVYRKVSAYLHAEVERAASPLDAALERGAAMFDEAHALSSAARRNYELLKEEHETWLEAKRTAARMSLEEAKSRGDIKKQITIDMVLDQVRAAWPDEYASKVRELRDVQAAVHRLEALPEAVRIRVRALEARVEIVKMTGGR